MGNNGQNRDTEKTKKKLQRQFEELESKIAVLKADKAKAEEALADPQIYSNKDKFQQAEKTYQQITGQLSNLESQYEKIFEELMGLD
jgi:ATP-binding cassette subfamily F protein 3